MRSRAETAGLEPAAGGCRLRLSKALQSPLCHVSRSAALRRRPVVGVAGFEPAASSSRTRRAAKLRHTPKCASPQPESNRCLLITSEPLWPLELWGRCFIEAPTGVEPVYAALQAAASPLGQGAGLSALGRIRTCNPRSRNPLRYPLRHEGIPLFGATDGDRTRDLLGHIQALCRLSYHRHGPGSSSGAGRAEGRGVDPPGQSPRMPAFETGCTAGCVPSRFGCSGGT